MKRLADPWMRYDWGSPTLIPELVGSPPDGRPVAEVWMGAHPSASSTVEEAGVAVSLGDLIASDPRSALGVGAMAGFGPRLPFMMKLLAADKPLSLQVHPTREQAAEGYRREDAAGLSVGDPARAYRDIGHKPEMLFALTPFEMMCGLRPAPVVRDVLADLDVPGLGPTLARLGDQNPERALRSALTLLLTADPHEQRALARAVQDSARERIAQRPAYQLVADLARHHSDDIGLVVSMFLNAVHLEPGEAVFLGAGTLHSYIRGLGVELMATSDNVLRAGLTTKHVDVPELLRLVNFTPGAPAKLSPHTGAGGSLTFTVPVPDFALWTLTGDTPAAVEGPATGARIALCCQGHATLTCGPEQAEVRAGEAVFIADADGPFTVSASGIVAVAHQPVASPDAREA